jgi:hypothetical protein
VKAGDVKVFVVAPVATITPTVNCDEELTLVRYWPLPIFPVFGTPIPTTSPEV